MRNFYLSIIAIFLFYCNPTSAQTFNGTGGAIPDDGTAPTCFPVTVSGVGAINSSHGLASICLDITHTWDSDLEISLHAPDGTIVNLAIQEGGSGDNYTNTCFTGTATQSITNGTAPFTGNYLPAEPLGTLNNGQNADGVWTLCIQDVFGGFTGTLNSWSITFNNTPAPPPPVQPPCSGNPPAGNSCDQATPVCNFSGYCGNTSASYTVNTWGALTNTFCGSIDNNSFVTFVASATTASFNVWVSNSTDGFGIQMMFYDGGCGSGAVTDYGCYNQINPSAFPSVITATGLTIGNTYYLMFDGYAGDVCDYTIAPISGVNILEITSDLGMTDSAVICSGQSVSLTATGGNGVYNWSGPNLNSTTGSTVTATPTQNSVYTITSVNPSGNCPITDSFLVVITVLPPPPAVTTSNITLCQNGTASPLSATGTSLLWYTSSTGGTGSPIAPTPSTTTVGSTTYYVTQTLSCGESPREPITVNIVSGIAAPVVTSPVTFCQNASATSLTATGSGLMWYTQAIGGTGSSTAPIPSTTTSGATTYYVSQTGSCGEGPRASITVNISAQPSAPTITTPITLCLNSTATPLTATGTSLLWYNNPNNGNGNVNAPTPSTTTSGNTNYYVSQTINGCVSPRAQIVVTVLSATNAPTVTTPVVYCQNATASSLTATGNGLLWYTTATGGTGSSSAPAPPTSVPGNFPYYVSQATNCGESPRATINVIVNPIPSAPVPGTSPSYCIGTSATPLTATGSSLLWYTAATGGAGLTTLTPATTPVGTATYYVSQTLLGCESPRASILVTITGLPAAPTVTDDTLIYCQNTTATPLSANGTAVLWYSTATGGTGSSTAPTPSTQHAGTTIYYATQTLSCGESPIRTPVVVIVDTTPVAPAITSPVVYCQGVNPIALQANGSNILWYNSATGGTGSSSAPIPSTAVVGNTDYYVSSTIGVCEGPRSSIRVTVNVTPPAPTVTTPVTYCQGNASVPLNATGSNILWYTQATGGTGSATAPVPSTSAAGSLSYYPTQTIGVCEGPRAMMDVLVLSTPNIGPDLYDTVCYNQTLDLTNHFNTAGLSVQWSLGGNPIPPPANAGVSGTYQLIVNNSNNCADTALLHFSVRPPVHAFAGNDTIALANQPHQLFATGGTYYSWSPAGPLNFSDVQNPLATLSADQMFIVTAYNSIGCFNMDSVFVRVYTGPTYHVPNAFTPNGDGLNDIFRPIPAGISLTNSFRIYDRWGKLVFSTNRWLYGWDGNTNGKKMPTGTYVWMIEGLDHTGKTVKQKGTVVLIR